MKPSVAAQREVAQRFAEAMLRGNAGDAAALLLHADDTALASFATHAAAPWKAHPGSFRPGVRAGRRWIFRYTGTRTHGDGRFEQVRGDLVVVVAASSKGAGIEFFAFRNEHVRFSTHHDSVLLPSNR
jgi:hypothetical protein